MSKHEIYGYSAIAFLLPVLLFLLFVLWQIYYNGFTYGRRLPMPPEHLRRKKRGVPKMKNAPPAPIKRCTHLFSIADIANLDIDPGCKYCGEKLSELKKKIKLETAKN